MCGGVDLGSGLLLRDGLDSRLEGTLKLWPFGGASVACVMTAPLDAPGLPLAVVNTCRAKLL